MKYFFGIPRILDYKNIGGKLCEEFNAINKHTCMYTHCKKKKDYVKAVVSLASLISPSFTNFCDNKLSSAYQQVILFVFFLGVSSHNIQKKEKRKKTVKLIEENIGGYLHYIGLGSDFLGMIPEHRK